MQVDPRIDEYINKAAPFAQPILQHLRRVIHKAVPQVLETIKWGFPHFDHKGILCSMAAFKEHCSFGFWKATLLKDPHQLLTKVGETNMGQFGKITSVKDLPTEKTLISYIKEAATLNENGVRLPAKEKGPGKKDINVPAELETAFKRSKKAKENFDAFSPSHKREYVEWINEAKTEATKERRINTAIDWLIEGKNMNWKYQNRGK